MPVGVEVLEPFEQKKPGRQGPDGEDMLYRPQNEPGVQSRHSLTLCFPREGLKVPGGQPDGTGEPPGQYEPIGHEWFVAWTVKPTSF
jgi:hypothetical protein